MNLNTACSIVYPLRDPVITDTARNAYEQDQREAYTAEIARRVNALIESGDLDLIKNEMTSNENRTFNMNLRVFCNPTTDLSRALAATEVRKVLNTAAERIAIWQCQEEMSAAAEAQAIERYYAQIERCAA